MGLLILLLVGAAVGWLASVVTRIEDSRGILFYAGAGIAGALLAGVLTNGGSVLLGLGALALLAAFLGAAAGAAALYYFRIRARS